VAQQQDREPSYREQDAKTITRLRGMVDPWFLCRYGMNLYRGCEHGCAYCDGRAERYYVPGDFGRDITVKRNAVAVLDRELSRLKEPGFMFLGGGVCDAYQPAERRYRLARGVLELAKKYQLPVHVLTKASLVERDFDLLAEINAQTRVILSFSIQTLDDELRARFEPAAASVTERLTLLSAAKELGMGVGVMAMPVLPGLSDQPETIDRLVGTMADLGADFVCGGGLTLRPGTQKETYFAVLRAHHAELVPGYERAYRSNRASGVPDPRYLARVDARFAAALGRHGLPGRPPRRLFTGLMPLYAEAAVLLEHRDFELQQAGAPGGRLGQSGHAIQHWARQSFAKRGRRKTFNGTILEAEFRAMVAADTLHELPGVTPAAATVVRDLVGEPRAEGVLFRA
jgi:DNA repair photolyase